MTRGIWTSARVWQSCWTADWIGGAGAAYGLLHIYRMGADNLWYLMRSVLYYANSGKTNERNGFRRQGSGPGPEATNGPMLYDCTEAAPEDSSKTLSLAQ